MVFPRKVLHMTVDSDGQISCWDNRDRALLGKEKHEVYIPLVLSLTQTEKIKDAAKQAKKNKGG